MAFIVLPEPLWIFWITAMGLFVGSFLNVAIHRLPLEDQTVSKPRRSKCPSCATVLTWRENVPLLSWLLQRGKCRTCGWSIPWRYPLVEALTAALWWTVAVVTPLESWDLLIVRLLVVSALVVATFVDFAHFEIPDEVSIGGIVLAPIASLLIPELHANSSLAWALTEDGATHVDRGAALWACLLGMAVGGGILMGIGALGKLIYGREAMGFGDVKLLCGAGGFIGAGGVVVVLMIASLSASVAGAANMMRFYWLLGARDRLRSRTRRPGTRMRTARIAGRYVPFGPYLALGIGIVLLGWNHVIALYQSLL